MWRKILEFFGLYSNNPKSYTITNDEKEDLEEYLAYHHKEKELQAAQENKVKNENERLFSTDEEEFIESLGMNHLEADEIPHILLDDELFEKDDDGNLIDEFGNLVDEYGRMIDESGNLIDEEGRLIDDEGNLIDEFGNFVDEDGFIIDPYDDERHFKDDYEDDYYR